VFKDLSQSPDLLKGLMDLKATEHKDSFWSADGPQTGHCICHGWCG
jgi:hypothetical protein